MTEDLLQHLGRIARLDHQRRGSVPQIMNPEPVAETGTTAGRDEGRASPVRQPHHAAARHGEHGLIDVPARDRSRARGGQEPGQRDGAGLVRFRGTQDDTTADIGKARRTSTRRRSKGTQLLFFIPNVSGRLRDLTGNEEFSGVSDVT
jgi:hypothetical protein